jgi:hypothetical protein
LRLTAVPACRHDHSSRDRVRGVGAVVARQACCFSRMEDTRVLDSGIRGEHRRAIGEGRRSRYATKQQRPPLTADSVRRVSEDRGRPRMHGRPSRVEISED